MEPSLETRAPVPEVYLAAAFERGRLAERQRLAQDLHDDLGARLLTLILRAHEPALVESLRATLSDLKALTRGLSASRARLSEAAADWQHDACMRLEQAGIALTWQLDCGGDVVLGAEQWLALGRVLRELLSNVIAHAQASTVAVRGALRAGWLELTVDDDGTGRAPQRWMSGLGLGGIQRRVAALGGSVHWAERAPRGIRCSVRVPLHAHAAPVPMPRETGAARSS